MIKAHETFELTDVSVGLKLNKFCLYIEGSCRRKDIRMCVLFEKNEMEEKSGETYAHPYCK